VADAHVNGAMPTVNSGAISNLNVGGGYTTFLQFDLSLLPAGTTAAQVSRAVLRLYANRVTTPGLVSFAPVTAAWGEYSVTYAAQPATGAAAGVFSVSGGGAFVAVDVTALVQAWVASPATNNGLALSAGTAAVEFDSKENDETSHEATLDIELVDAGPVGATGSAGPVGPAGPVGAMGLAGAVGAAGVAGAIGPLGLTGATGATGAVGATGPAGPAGTSGGVSLSYEGIYASTTNYALNQVVQFQGSSYISLIAGNAGNTPGVNPTTWGVLAEQGPVGLTGSTGAAGPMGVQGLPGNVGPNGPQGAQGVQGIAGQAGAQGIPGATGATGLSGPMGPQGVAGPVGLSFQGVYSSITNYALADGVSYNGTGYVSLVAENHGNTPNVSPSQWALFAAAGATGATGSIGLTGATGATGATGVAGPQGLVGATGATGAQGPPVANYLGNYQSSVNYALNDAVSWQGSTYISLVAGNNGNTPSSSPVDWAVLAAQGATGVAGPMGATGPAGVTGGVGPAGATGPAGPTGATGLAGAVGMNFRGAWVSGTEYSLNDAVTFAGATYLAEASNSSSEPDLYPQLWAVLAAVGGAGPTGAAGTAATLSVGTVTTGAPGSSAAVTNSGTSAAAVLNFTIPQGAAGAVGSGGGGGGTSGIPFASMYHAVSDVNFFYSVNSSTSSVTEGAAVLTWVPTACTATELTVFSQQANTITVTLRAGAQGSMNAALSCSVASGGSCTATGSAAVAAGSFLDIGVSGANGTPAGVWTAVACN
jgi:hypothetical protein